MNQISERPAPVEPALARLTTTDGQLVTVNCAAGQSVVTAAGQAGISLPAQCRQGTCGACQATVVRGCYDLAEHSPAVLPAEAAAAGGVLLCRTYPRGPIEVQLPYDHSRILVGPIPERRATIAALEVVARDTIRLQLQLAPDPGTGAGLEFDPGQFVELAVPGSDTWRAYSLANTANWDGLAELYIRVRPTGHFSDFLRRDARVGAELMVRGPQGAFGLRETGRRPRWFVAGGTGLAPLLSMLRRMAEWGEPHPVRLYLGFNEPEEIFGEAEVAAVGAGLAEFRYEIWLWRADPRWSGPIGAPTEGLARDLPAAPEDPDVYVCGPPPLVAAAGAVLRQHGLAPDRLIVERFGAG